MLVCSPICCVLLNICILFCERLFGISFAGRLFISEACDTLPYNNVLPGISKLAPFLIDCAIGSPCSETLPLVFGLDKKFDSAWIRDLSWDVRGSSIMLRLGDVINET